MKEWAAKKYRQTKTLPVLRLDFSGANYNSEKVLDSKLNSFLKYYKEYIYIIEIKINDTVEAALQQIEEKAYVRRFADDRRKLFKIGVRFATEKRCIEDWKVVK